LGFPLPAHHPLVRLGGPDLPFKLQRAAGHVFVELLNIILEKGRKEEQVSKVLPQASRVVPKEQNCTTLLVRKCNINRALNTLAYDILCISSLAKNKKYTFSQVFPILVD